MRRKTSLLIASVAAVAVAGVGVGVAEAAGNATPTAPPSATPAAPANPGHHPGLLSRVAHGQFTLNGKQHRTLDVQRGTVQAVSGTSMTVRSSDGYTASYALNGNTKVRKNKQPSSVSQVAVNDRVVVLAGRTGSTVTADRIGDGGPAPASH